ncbi:PP2C family protein-serine/threonine phosphatase [Nocardioides terrisoli]|uniref:PP2C family protein-serine/threonine phosphatase n=1 Tax=Nocardioides terrisoli TaxID=3388267 RepID=UPI00287B987D|nr:SpoIIE family protein phosphatase [Nocardioides marmorisolisilvae]
MSSTDPSNDPGGQLHRLEAVTDLALTQLDLDDLLPELLDRVRDLLRADTAAVLLMDDSGQHLLATAARGLEEEVFQGSRIPVGRGFAGMVANSREPVVVTEVSPATVVNPVLLHKGVRSMLGVPLLVGDEVLGVLHVGSLQPREFSPDEVALLQLAAERAASAVSQLRARTSRQAAGVLQRGLLPSGLPRQSGLELAARYVPGGQLGVGGDWYDVFDLPGERLGIVVGDVAGHGLLAAIVMGRLRSALRAYALVEDDPGRVLDRLDQLMRAFEPDQMATAVYLVYEKRTGLALIASAGHLPPMVGHRESSLLLALGEDPPLGTVDEVERRTTEMVVLPGTRICLYTDGLVERRGQDIDTGLWTMRRVVAAAADDSADQLAALLMSELIGQEGAEDDVALLVLRRPEGGDDEDAVGGPVQV